MEHPGLLYVAATLLPLASFMLLLLAGALFAKFYLWRRFGKEQWLRTAPVVAAGFVCGFGLAGMFCFGLVLIQKTVTALLW